MPADVPMKNHKRSYTVPCSSEFRDSVSGLARRRGGNVADIARSVVLLVPRDAIDAFPDPGGPAADDREVVVLKSGPAEGRPWRRKPRLQVRMEPGLDTRTIRRALGIALALDRGDVDVRLEKSFDPAAASRDRRQGDKALESLIRETRDDLERLRAMVSVLSFEPLSGGVKTRDDALHVLGLPPGRLPDQVTLRGRFRMLATIHHPDGLQGSHKRMSQLNTAMELLVRGAA